MEPIVIFLGASISFLLGYLFGHRDLRHEDLLRSLSVWKEKVVSSFTPRKKVVILDSKDDYMEEENQ